MNSTLTSTLDSDRALVTPAVTALAGDGPVALRWLGGGRNSRVYRVDGRRGDAYVAKVYHAGDDATPNAWLRIPMADAATATDAARDRRSCEFAALRFLWDNGVRCIPEPVETFRDPGVSILRLVEGDPLTAEDVTSSDVDALVSFLVHLDYLKDRPASQALPDASEACYSLAAIGENIRTRLAHLHVAADAADSTASEQLRAFLTDAMAPVLTRALEAATLGFSARGEEPDTELPLAERTLSPSDFGFHNALRRRDGSLVFLDFEHFGWDDPSKMVCDFLLHPALSIPGALAQSFMQRACRDHPLRRVVRWRVPIVYPLYALKWCTILLNEFIPEHEHRRAFATQSSRDREVVLAEQLAKAEVMLETARLAEERFPYDA